MTGRFQLVVLAGCSFDPDGKRLLVWGGSVAQVVHLADGITQQRLEHEGNPQLVSAAWSPDGNYVAFGGSHHDAYVWHLTCSEQPLVLHGHQTWVTSVEFSPDGRLLSTSASDSSTRLWEYWTGKELLAVKGFAGRFSLDGRRLVGILDSQIVCWEVASGAVLQELRSQDATYEVMIFDVSPHGDLLAAATVDGVRFWDLHSHKEIGGIDTGFTTGVAFVQGPSGQVLVSASKKTGLEQRSIGIQADGSLHVGHPTPLVGSGWVLKMVVSAVGDTLVLLNRDGRPIRIQLGNKSPEYLSINRDGFQDLTLSAKGKWIATTGTDSGVQIWNSQGRLIRELAIDTATRAALFDPTGRQLVVVTSDELLFFDTKTWKIRHRMSWPMDQSVLWRNTMDFSPDGRILAVSTAAHGIKLVAPQTGEIFATLPSDYPKGCVTFTPDGKRLVITGPEMTLQIWNLDQLEAELEKVHLGWVQ